MKKEKVTDERIITQRRKIQSDAYQILIYCLLAAVLIQQFFLRAPISQFAAEFLCVLGVEFYIALRRLAEGVDTWQKQNQTTTQRLLGSLNSGVILTFLMVFLAGEKDYETLAQIFLAFAVTTFVVKAILQHVSIKRKKQLEKNLDAQEQEGSDI